MPRLSASQRIRATLQAIKRRPGLTARQIGAATGEAPDRYAVITLYYRMILGLIKDGLIWRDQDNGHHLTEEGNDYLRQVIDGSQDIQSALSYLNRNTPRKSSPRSRPPKRPRMRRRSPPSERAVLETKATDVVPRAILEKGQLKKRQVDLCNRTMVETTVLEILLSAGDRDVVEMARSVGDESSGQVAVRQAVFALLRRKMIVQLPNPKGGEKKLSILSTGIAELDLRSSTPVQEEAPSPTSPAPPPPPEEPVEEPVVSASKLRSLKRSKPRPVPPAKPIERFLPDRWTFSQEMENHSDELAAIVRTMIDRGDLLRHLPTGAMKLERAHIASVHFLRDGRARDRWQGIMDGRMTAGRISNIVWRKERGIKNALDKAIIEGYLVLENDLYAPISLVSRLPDGFDRKWVMPSKFLELDESIQHELDRSGIRFIGDVIRIEPLDLETHPRLPAGTSAVVRKALNRYGLDFQDDVPRTTSMACLHRNWDLLKD